MPNTLETNTPSIYQIWDETERALLGSILLSSAGQSDLLKRATELVQPESMSPRARHVLSAMDRIFRQKMACDLVMLRSELARTQELASAGGDDYIISLADCPVVGATESYALQLRKLVRKSHSLKLVHDIEKRLIAGDGLNGELEELVQIESEDGGESETLPPPVAADALQSIQLPKPDYVLFPLASIGRLTLIQGEPKGGKALAIDTPILTGTGWTTMADIEVGMKVHSCDGTLTEVVAVSPIMHNHPCYRIETKSGASLIADAEHLWCVFQRDRKMVMTTTELSRHHERRWLLPTPSPIERGAEKLPLDPWILGYWLGNGTTINGGVTSHGDDIDFVLKQISDAGFAHGKLQWKTNCSNAVTVTVLGLKQILRKMGVLGNKHVPEQYLLSSKAQRMSLLAGLMDSDGYAATKVNGSGIVEFCSTSEILAANVLFLIRSLGYKARSVKGVAKLYGKVVSPKWRIMFSASRFDSPFFSSRKYSALPVREPSQRSLRDAIVSIDRVKSVPVRCIMVAHPSRTYLAGTSLTVTHNSCFAFYCAVSAAIGAWVSDRFEASEKGPRKTLFITYEDDLQRIQDRLNQYMKGFGGVFQAPPNLIVYAHPDAPDMLLETAEGRSTFRKVLQQNQVEFCVIDTMSFIHESDENQSKDMKPIMRWVRKTIADLKCALMLIHHTGKPGQVERSVAYRSRGSSAIPAACDVILDFGIRPQPNHTLCNLISKDSKNDEFIVRYDESGDRSEVKWSLLDVLEREDILETQTKLIVAMQKLLQTSPDGVLTSTICEALPQIPDRTIRRYLGSLLKKGTVTKKAGPKNGSIWILNQDSL